MLCAQHPAALPHPSAQTPLAMARFPCELVGTSVEAARRPHPRVEHDGREGQWRAHRAGVDARRSACCLLRPPAGGERPQLLATTGGPMDRPPPIRCLTVLVRLPFFPPSIGADAAAAAASASASFFDDARSLALPLHSPGHDALDGGLLARGEGSVLLEVPAHCPHRAAGIPHFAP